MADNDEGEIEIGLEKKTLYGKVCSVFRSRFTWIIVVYLEVLLTQYVLLTYLSPFFPTVANGLGSSSTFSYIHVTCCVQLQLCNFVDSSSVHVSSIFLHG